MTGSLPAPSGSDNDSRLPSAVAAGLAFVPSAVTLLVEVVAIRLLAPRIGSSIETYTAAIGVVLAGLALGAYVGGRAADAFGPRRLVRRRDWQRTSSWPASWTVRRS